MNLIFRCFQEKKTAKRNRIWRISCTTTKTLPVCVTPVLNICKTFTPFRGNPTLQSYYFSLTTTVIIFFFSGSQWLTKGIAKGVLMFNNFTGFWLIHSVPGFPPFSERGYDYPQSGRTRGHIFFCVSVNVFEIDAIGSLFSHNMPHFYDWYIPAAMTTRIPNLMSVLHGMRLLPYIF